MTDPIADMLSRIRNAQLSKKPDVVIPYSKLKHNLANIFVKEGYIEMAEKID
ncbi:MAG: 30S ribosomal protein S8, partial [Patescibacteria group bacterium]